MPRVPKPWWWAQLGEWCVTIKRKRHRLGKDEKEAKRKCHELLGQREETKVPGKSVAAIIDLFLAWMKDNRAPETYDWYQKHLQSFLDALKPSTMDVSKLKAHHVETWANQWKGSYKRGALTAVGRMMSWAAKKEHIEINAIRGRLDKPAPVRREVYITADQYEVILTHVRKGFRDLLIVAWETGCRPQEVTKVEARHVDLKNARWVFSEAESKGKKKKRVVYLSETALGITKRLMKENPTGPLFRNNAGNPWDRWLVASAFGRLQKKIDFRYRLYDFRFSFCTNAIRNGVDIVTLQHLMGHTDLQMISRIYALVAQDVDHMRRAAAKAVAIVHE